jgi:hypothetical protein
MMAALAAAACRGGHDKTGTGSASGPGPGTASSPATGPGAGTGATTGPGAGSSGSGAVAGTGSHGPTGAITKDSFRDQIQAYVLATLRPLCPADATSCVDNPADPPHPLVAWRPADPTTLLVSVLMPSFDDQQLIDLNVSFCDLVAELGDRLDDGYIIQARIVNLPAAWGTNSQPFTTSGSTSRMIAKLERNHRLNITETTRLLGAPTFKVVDGKRIAIHKLDDGGEVRIPVEAPHLPDIRLVDPRGTIRPVSIRFAIPRPTGSSPTTIHPTPTPIRPGTLTTPIRPTPTTPTPIRPTTPR